MDKQKEKRKMSLRKGDRVEYLKNGVVEHYGVISKGGKNVTMVIDGAKQQISGPTSLFQLSEYPLPVDIPNPMDKWSVKKFKAFKDGHGDSPTFSATICLNNKKVGTAENNGWGGPNLYYFNSRSDGSKFDSDIKEWAFQFSAPSDAIELADFWLFWYVEEKSYGVTSEEMIKNLYNNETV